MGASRKKRAKRRPRARKATSSAKKAEPRPPAQEQTVEPESGDQVLDMDQAIALLKTTRPTFYRWLRAGKLRGMKVGRQWRFYRSDVEAFLRGEGPRIALPAPVTTLLEDLRRIYRELGGKASDLSGRTELEQAAYLMAGVAARMRASDVHIHATVVEQVLARKQGDEDAKSAVSPSVRAVIRMRVDGVLHTVVEFDNRLLQPVIEQWKALTGADLSGNLISQDGRGMLKVEDTTLDIRSSFVHTALGEAVTMRLIPRTILEKLSLERLDLSAEAKTRLKEQLNAASGLIVVTGPTGCGKTTTLCSALTHIAKPGLKIMTLEDPVELLLEGIVQIQVRPDQGLTFQKGLIRIFRSDPDVVLVGETRDRETLEICCKGAATGHLILTTLHAPTAVSALFRVGMMVDDPGLAFPGEVLRLVLAQRLVRKICPDCAKPYDPAADVLQEAEMRACEGGVDWDSLPKDFRKPHGCKQCAKTGYRGRLAVGEALTITPAVLQALRSDAEPGDVEKVAVEQGMVTMPAQGVRLAAAGVTTLEEVLRIF